MRNGRIFAWTVDLGNGLMGSWMGKWNGKEKARRRETSLEVSLGSRPSRQGGIGASVLILTLWNREKRYRATEGSARSMRVGGC